MSTVASVCILMLAQTQIQLSPASPNPRRTRSRLVSHPPHLHYKNVRFPLFSASSAFSAFSASSADSASIIRRYSRPLLPHFPLSRHGSHFPLRRGKKCGECGKCGKQRKPHILAMQMYSGLPAIEFFRSREVNEIFVVCVDDRLVSRSLEVDSPFAQASHYS